MKWLKMSFPVHGVGRKVVDNVENYLHMHFQPILISLSREYTLDRLNCCKKNQKKLMTGRMRYFMTD